MTIGAWIAVAWLVACFLMLGSAKLGAMLGLTIGLLAATIFKMPSKIWWPYLVLFWWIWLAFARLMFRRRPQLKEGQTIGEVMNASMQYETARMQHLLTVSPLASPTLLAIIGLIGLACSIGRSVLS